MYAVLFVALFAVLALSRPVPCDHSPAPSYSSSPSPSPSPSPSYSPSPSPSPSYSPSPSPSYSPSPSPAPTTSTQPSGDASSGVYSGGQATFFYQGGNAGACGIVHSDSDYICALDSALFDMSQCGKQVQITNTDNGQQITVTVADECPTCLNADSIDLSVAAFSALSDNNLGLGVFPIEWEFV